jgi:predicted transposase YdaD
MTMEEEVFERGVKIGIEKGKAQGKRKSALNSARKMLEHDITWDVITDVTGIKPEDLNALELTELEPDKTKSEDNRD